jgi:hypothetical protein
LISLRPAGCERAENERHSGDSFLQINAERIVQDNWKPIGALWHAFIPQECADYFSNAPIASI